MDKAYVILKKGFEYDDNIYSEGDGGYPNLIVFNKEEAIKKVNELNINEYKRQSISNYSYDLSDILKSSVDEYKNFNKSLIQKYGEIEKKNRWDDFENILHPMANESESVEYSKLVDISFYDVMETPIDKQSFREEKINQVLDDSSL